MTLKLRLDQILVENGFADTREKAKRLILAGEVLVSEKVSDKPGQLFAADVPVRVRSKIPYVSRGGEKLASVYEALSFPVENLVFMDVGASTGGFTDFLLQNGARLIYAIDVGTNQLAYALRTNPRVVSIEKTHIKDLHIKQVVDKIDGFVIDVSFISVAQVLPFLSAFGSSEHFLVCLIKPQFEVGKGNVPKGGVVRDEALIKQILERDLLLFQDYGYAPQALEFSRVPGPKGNVEYFCYAIYGADYTRSNLVDLAMQKKQDYYVLKSKEFKRMNLPSGFRAE